MSRPLTSLTLSLFFLSCVCIFFTSSLLSYYFQNQTNLSCSISKWEYFISVLCLLKIHFFYIFNSKSIVNLILYQLFWRVCVCFTDHSTFQFSLRCMCPSVFQRLFIQDLMVLTSLSVYLCLYFTVLKRIVKYFFFVLLHGRNRLPLISVIYTLETNMRH